MKKLYFLISLLIFLSSACSDSTVSDDTENKLILGTGLGHGTVTGVSDSFNLDPDGEGVLIQWMLESKRDMGGGYIVSILIEEKVGDEYVERILYDYEPTEENFVFYYIDSFYHQLGVGNFRAAGFVGSGKVASQTYTVTYDNKD